MSYDFTTIYTSIGFAHLPEDPPALLEDPPSTALDMTLQQETFLHISHEEMRHLY
jgi:hypothetical protein